MEVLVRHNEHNIGILLKYYPHELFFFLTINRDRTLDYFWLIISNIIIKPITHISPNKLNQLRKIYIKPACK